VPTSRGLVLGQAFRDRDQALVTLAPVAPRWLVGRDNRPLLIPYPDRVRWRSASSSARQEKTRM